MPYWLYLALLVGMPSIETALVVASTLTTPYRIGIVNPAIARLLEKNDPYEGVSYAFHNDYKMVSYESYGVLIVWKLWFYRKSLITNNEKWFFDFKLVCYSSAKLARIRCGRHFAVRGSVGIFDRNFMWLPN